MWDLQQGTEEWLAIRRCFLTASDFSTVLGWNPYKTVEELVHELHNDGKPERKITRRQHEAMDWGRHHEPDAIFAYGLSRYGFMDEKDWGMSAPGIVIDWNKKLAASPDRFLADNGILETKCPFYGNFYKEDMPLYHKAQVLGLLGVTGRAYADYSQFLISGGIKTTRMVFDDEMKREWASIKEILEDFVDNHEDIYAKRRLEVLSADPVDTDEEK